MLERVPGPPGSGEFVLRAWVRMSQIRDDSSKPVEGTTTYRAFKWHTDQGGTESFYDYIYTYAEPQQRDGMIGFNFAKPKTDEQKRTPFRSFLERSGNHPWPDILTALAVTADYTFPRAGAIIKDGELGTVTGPSYRVSEANIPQMNEGTRFLVQEFCAPTVFTIPRYRVPGATSVSLALPDGTTYRHPECLHDDIEIEALNTASSTYLAGSESTVGGNILNQKFPASNFSRWRPYWFSDEQVLREGLWFRRRVRVIPPRPSQPQIIQN